MHLVPLLSLNRFGFHDLGQRERGSADGVRMALCYAISASVVAVEKSDFYIYKDYLRMYDSDLTAYQARRIMVVGAASQHQLLITCAPPAGSTGTSVELRVNNYGMYHFQKMKWEPGYTRYLELVVFFYIDLAVCKTGYGMYDQFSYLSSYENVTPFERSPIRCYRARRRVASALAAWVATDKKAWLHIVRTSPGGKGQRDSAMKLDEEEHRELVEAHYRRKSLRRYEFVLFR
ncbi:hypothetical protein EDB84DRAFT_1439295 [Lactarius hengduanensis]|nr:hypothetical protein EDB84DRAFT_1439295 [Lactarius hengduanensis]